MNFQEIEQLFSQQCGSIKLDHNNASGFMNTVERMSGELGIHTPKVEVIDHIQGAGNYGIYNAGATLNKEKIVVTKELLKLFDSTDLSVEPDSRLQAILGHEMGHIKNMDNDKMICAAPLLILPVAAMAGLYLYEKVQDDKQQKSKQEAQEMLNDEERLLLQTASSPRDKLSLTPHEKLKQDAITVGKYMAAAGLGLAAGIFITRQLYPGVELRADAAGASLTSNQAMKDALEQLSGATNELVAKQGHGDLTPPSLAHALRGLLTKYPTIAERCSALS